MKAADVVRIGTYDLEWGAGGVAMFTKGSWLFKSGGGSRLRFDRCEDGSIRVTITCWIVRWPARITLSASMAESLAKWLLDERPKMEPKARGVGKGVG